MEVLVVTGGIGSGKSEVGKRLAEKLGRPFLDTDALITEKTGFTPAQLIRERSVPGLSVPKADLPPRKKKNCSPPEEDR